MLIKTFTLHSLPYIVGIVSSIAATHQIAPSLETALRLHSDTSTKIAISSGHAVNRSLKSDRLPIKQAAPRTNGKGPFRVPAQIVQSPKINTGCHPPIDVVGRCFSEIGPSHKVV